MITPTADLLVGSSAQAALAIAAQAEARMIAAQAQAAAQHAAAAAKAATAARATRSQARAALTAASASTGTFSGMASWYGAGFDGHATASGATYDEDGLSAASRTLPLGSGLRVCRGSTCVVVVVNDRGPYVGGRVLDLSRGAAARLDMLGAGVAYVTATPLA